MKPILIDQNQKFNLSGIDFVIDVSAGKRRRQSDSEAFTLVKNEPYIRFYESLAASVKPKGVLELGIFQGGSYVFLDKLLKPERMSAIDINPEPVIPLVNYLRQNKNRHANFGISQSDKAALERIVAEDLGGMLDFVIDDASHAYEHTKCSFEILFPLLAPGGIYVIEDWSWAHHHAYQTERAPFAGRPALTNLLFEQIIALASTNLIAEIQVRKSFYLLKKSQARVFGEADIWSQMLLRGRTYHHI